MELIQKKQPNSLIRNGQGDITGLIDSSGRTVIEYRYDTWGKDCGLLPEYQEYLDIQELNPFRYRGYVYDIETGWYYLQSRYYDPEIGRFLSADVLLSTGQGVLGHNTFAYCGNNPVSRVDANGRSWDEVEDWIKDAWEKMVRMFKTNIGTSSSVVMSDKQSVSIIPDPWPITIDVGTKETITISEVGDSSQPISLYSKRDNQDVLMLSTFGVKINVSNNTIDFSFGLEDMGITFSTTEGQCTESFGIYTDTANFKLRIRDSSTVVINDSSSTKYLDVGVSAYLIIALIVYTATGDSQPFFNSYPQAAPQVAYSR